MIRKPHKKYWYLPIW